MPRAFRAMLSRGRWTATGLCKAGRLRPDSKRFNKSVFTQIKNGANKGSAETVDALTKFLDGAGDHEEARAIRKAWTEQLTPSEVRADLAMARSSPFHDLDPTALAQLPPADAAAAIEHWRAAIRTDAAERAVAVAKEIGVPIKGLLDGVTDEQIVRTLGVPSAVAGDLRGIIELLRAYPEIGEDALNLVDATARKAMERRKRQAAKT